MDKWNGVFPAVVTPLSKAGDIIEPALRKHLDYLLESGVHGFYLGGSTGEGIVLPPEVRERLLEIVADHIQPYNKTLIVHIGAVDTRTSVRLAKHAEHVGVDAISSVPPFYYRVDEQAMYNFYRDISEAADVPLIIYNIPELTGVVVNAAMASRMMELKHVIGIKFSNSDLSEMRKMKEIGDGEFRVFFGVDQSLLSGLVTGADGGIGGTYNCMPAKYVEIYEAFRNNDSAAAAAVQHRVARYFHIMSKYKSMIAVLKHILTAVHGVDMGTVTGPLRELTPAEQASLMRELEEAGFFDFISRRG